MLGQIIFSLIVAVLIMSVAGLLSLAIIPLSFTRETEEDRERKAQKRREKEFRKVRKRIEIEACKKYPGPHNYRNRERYMEKHL